MVTPQQCGILQRACYASALVLLLVCGTVAAKEVAPTITVHDFSGRALVLDQPARRIVALGPNLVEILFEIGAAGRVVGASDYADYPPAARDITRVSRVNIVNFELLLTLEPDLVLVWESGFPVSTAARLAQLGIPYYLAEPSALADVERLMRDLGNLAGMSDRAREAADDFARRRAQLASRYQRREPVAVFYQVWHQPLQTLNGAHLVSAVIELCGGENVFAELPAIAPQVSVESVIDANPQVIIASGSDGRRPAWLDDWLRWPMIDAVRDAQLHFVPPDILVRHSPRIIEGAERVCAILQGARDMAGAAE